MYHKNNGTTTDDAENLVLVMSLYNLIEYSSNYLKRQGVYGFILKMIQLILMLILPMAVISRKRLNYQEILMLMEQMELYEMRQLLRN